MSRISNALNMYFLLLSRGFMTVDDLARELEVTHRMVKEYKRDLEMAGIYIESKLGRYGGYYIEKNRGLDGLNLTNDELRALHMAKETIQSGKYHYSSKFEILANKILSKIQRDDEVYYHNKVLNESDEILNREKRTWIDINIAINHKKRIIMEYKSLKEEGVEVSERVVEPYGVFDYKGATYFYGYCTRAYAIRFFKLSRIVKYTILDERFATKVEFDFDEVMEKSIGIFNDESIELKLKIYYPMSEIVKDKQLSKEQKIIQIDEKTILFQAKMKGYTEIKTWVMSMGSRVEVLEPPNLKDDILQEIRCIQYLYQYES